MIVEATDGSLAEGPYPESKAYLGGFSIVDFLPAGTAGVVWRIAEACRCAQEGLEFGPRLLARITAIRARLRKAVRYRRSPTLACASVPE